MITSLDGRLHPARWSDPAEGSMAALVERHYDATAERLEADGWIVGRRTMAAYVARDEAPSALFDAPRTRPPHLVDRAGRSLGVVIDPSGRLHHDRCEIGGDMVVAVLSQRVPDAYLARLREVGVAYLFAGDDGSDLAGALETLRRAFGVGHLLLEGGGVLLVNRGYVPDAKRDPANRAQAQTSGTVTLTGLLRSSDKRSWFSPDDQPAKKLFYTRDLAVISQSLGLEGLGKGQVAPFVLEADATPNAGGWPKGGQTVVQFTDNHLLYALTWFSLAIGVLILFGVWYRQNRTA